MTGQIFPMAAALAYKRDNNWRGDFFDFLNERLDAIEKDVSMDMDKLEDITGAILRNRSEILGQLALGFVKDKFAHLLDQEFFECPHCGKLLKARRDKVKREIETLIGKLALYRPYFYCKRCKRVLTTVRNYPKMTGLKLPHTIVKT